jgi:hypothetical protein
MFTESPYDVDSGEFASGTSATVAFDLRRCCTCQQHLPSEQFSFKNKARGTRHTKCKACMRAYAKRHYADNVETYVAKAKVHNAEYAEHRRAALVTALGAQRCERCSSSHDLVCYDTRGYKGGAEQTVHMAVHGGLGEAAVKEALQRGHLLCRHCLGKLFAGNIAFWANANGEERKRIQAEREKAGFVKTPKSAYKAYRRRSLPT